MYVQGTTGTAYCRTDHYVNEQIFRSANRQTNYDCSSLHLNDTVYFFKFLSLEMG